MEFVEYARRVELISQTEIGKAQLIAYFLTKARNATDFELSDLLALWGMLQIPQPNATRLAGRLTASTGFPRSPKSGFFRLHAEKVHEFDAAYSNLFEASVPVPRSGSRDLIDEARLAELRSLSGCKLDPARLIRICEEINGCYAWGGYMSVALLSRTLINHVPPVFGYKTFSEVANNYGGATSGKSFKKVAAKLDDSARNIGDMIAHETMRPVESLPSIAMIDFSQELDVLLGEVVRLLKIGSAKP